MDTTTARALSSRLADLLSREQAAMADFLVALADFDRRRLWERLGYTSLWHHLHRELGLSKSAAFYRREAAMLLQRFPEMEAPLRDGRLCLSSVAELATWRVHRRRPPRPPPRPRPRPRLRPRPRALPWSPSPPTSAAST